MLYARKDARLTGRRELGMRGYVLADTRPTAGFRPGTVRLGELERIRVVRRRRLGDDMDPSQAQVFQETGQNPDFSQAAGNALSQFTAAQVASALAALDQDWQTVMSNRAADVDWFSRNGSSLPAADQAAYTAALAAQMQDVNRLGQIYTWALQGAQKLGLNAPQLSGLGALGIAPALAAVVIALVAIAGASIVAYEISTHVDHAYSAHVQAQTIQQNNAAITDQVNKLRTDLAAATTRGDVVGAATIQAQISDLLKRLGGTPPQDPNSMGAWFQNNWGWLMVGAAGLVALNNLL